jgi:hypothetical protein
MKRLWVVSLTAMAFWGCSPFNENISVERDQSSKASKVQTRPDFQGISWNGSRPPLPDSPNQSTLVSLGNSYSLQSQTLIQSGRSVSSTRGYYILETYGLDSKDP